MYQIVVEWPHYCRLKELFYNFFRIEANVIDDLDMKSSIELDMNHMDFRLVNNQKENSHYDRIPSNLKGI